MFTSLFRQLLCYFHDYNNDYYYSFFMDPSYRTVTAGMSMGQLLRGSDFRPLPVTSMDKMIPWLPWLRIWNVQIKGIEDNPLTLHSKTFLYKLCLFHLHIWRDERKEHITSGDLQSLSQAFKEKNEYQAFCRSSVLMAKTANVEIYISSERHECCEHCTSPC